MSYSTLRCLFPIFVTLLFVFSFLNVSDIFSQGNLSSDSQNEDMDILIVPAFSNSLDSEDSTVLYTQITNVTSNPALTIKTVSPSTNERTAAVKPIETVPPSTNERTTAVKPIETVSPSLNERTTAIKPIDHRKVTLTRMGTRGSPFANFRPITYYSEKYIDESERRAYWDSFGSDKLNQSNCYHSLSLGVPSGRKGISVRFSTPGPGIGMNLQHLANAIIYARHHNYTIFFYRLTITTKRILLCFKNDFCRICLKSSLRLRKTIRVV